MLPSYNLALNGWSTAQRMHANMHSSAVLGKPKIPVEKSNGSRHSV